MRVSVFYFCQEKMTFLDSPDLTTDYAGPVLCFFLARPKKITCIYVHPLSCHQLEPPIDAYVHVFLYATRT